MPTSLSIFLQQTMLWPHKNRLTLPLEDYLCVGRVGWGWLIYKAANLPLYAFSPQFKESALRKQSLYLKFDPLLRDSPRKQPIFGTIEANTDIMTAPLQCG